MSTATVTTLSTTNPQAGGSVALIATPRVGTPRLRLTRRGRVVFTSLAAIPVVAGVMMVALNGGGATAESSSIPRSETVEVTLHAGQSLWQLAEQIAPGVDPREVISDIQAVNDITGSVQAGQRLTVPSAYVGE